MNGWIGSRCGAGRAGRLAAMLACALGIAVGATAEEHDTDERVARDLLTVITMDGHPCGRVVEMERHGDEDYTVSCSSGDRYRVRIVDGRVRIEKL